MVLLSGRPKPALDYIAVLLKKRKEMKVFIYPA
jgi:hypothetical protein